MVGKLYNESQNLGLASVFAYKPRQSSHKLLQEESFLLFLWKQLETQQLRPVVFLQVVAHLKMLDANEQYAFQESRNGSL